MDELDTARQMEQTAEEARQQASQSGAQMKDKARDYGSQAADRAREVRDRMSENARSIADQAREQVSHGAQQLRDRSESLIDSQKGRAAEEVSHFSAAIRSAADRLRDEQNDTIAGYAESLAGQLDQASNYLRDRDLMSVFHDAQSFARRRPEIVLGGMFIAGLAIARFMKVATADTRGAHRDYDRQGYGGADEYGSYSGYSGAFTEGNAYRGGGVEADTDYIRNRNAPAEAAVYGAEANFGGIGAGGLAGGLEHVDSPAEPGSIGGPVSTADDADITQSSDITSGTKPGGPPSVQP